ncbi:uncharacterized protein LOC116852830 [Odontomachus brunneus]|uniref:uncharacterized protein LOC116852830 n=1 Tax=Odontomachus brunneus TaxID=486640 RepID=UPI0013F228A2|nr:uncharacterized protein LOC116852830 [Odontomachus brunneus]
MQETSTSEKSIDKENTISFSLCQDDILLSTFNNKKTYQSHPIFQSSNIDRIPLQSIDEPCSSKQHNVPMSTNMSTQLTIASKESLTSNASSVTRCSRKRPKTSAVEETQQHITNTLDNQNENFQVYYPIFDTQFRVDFLKQFI